ncbi:MAG: hypothetical protein J5621_05030 [Paludibacteraceae bacterium]|nr:hypothetical protein [Paludibacteraceae bacterium]
MKNNLFMYLLIAVCLTVFVGCGDKEKPYPTSYMEIRGVITDEQGLPLESISICIDSASAHLDHTMSYEEGAFTDHEGEFFMLCRGGSPAVFKEGWPSEMILIATDTTGTYATQEKVFSVEVRHFDWIKNYSHALVTADFIMKKKK